MACEAATALPHTGTHTNANLLGSRDTNKERTQEHANYTQTQTHTQRVLRRRVWTLIVERLLAVSTPGQTGEHVGPWGGRLRWAASQGLDSAPHIVNRLFTLVEGIKPYAATAHSTHLRSILGELHADRSRGGAPTLPTLDVLSIRPNCPN